MIQVPTLEDFTAMRQEMEALKVRIMQLERRPNPVKWVPASVAAESLGMSVSHVRKLCAEGVLKVNRMGRKVLIDMESIEEKARLGKHKHQSSAIINPLPEVHVDWQSKRGRPKKSTL